MNTLVYNNNNNNNNNSQGVINQQDRKLDQFHGALSLVSLKTLLDSMDPLALSRALLRYYSIFPSNLTILLAFFPRVFVVCSKFLSNSIVWLPFPLGFLYFVKLFR